MPSFKQTCCLFLAVTASSLFACQSTAINNPTSAINPSVQNHPEAPRQAPSPFTTPEQKTIVSFGWKLTNKSFRKVDHKLKFSIEGEYPQIDNSTDARALKFNREIKSRIARQYSLITVQDPEESREHIRAYPGEDPLDTAEFSYEVLLSTDELLSIRFHDMTYSRGAAHPSEAFFTLNYELKTGTVLHLRDIFKPKVNYLGRLEELCKARFDKKVAEYLFPDSLSRELQNYNEWNITYEGLAMNFDRCAIAACAAGEFSVVIPYQDLDDLLNRNNPVFLLSPMAQNGASERREG